MAGIAIPDNLRPTLAVVAKHHFWILAGLVPLVLVPTLLMGTGGLRSRIVAAKRQIDAKLGQARAVTAVQPHPNEAWRAAIDADTEALTRETLDEWRRFWHAQATLRTWPTDLGKEFLDDVAALKPAGKLDRQSLVRYENTAPRLARSLPLQMGVEDMMVEARGDGAPGDLLRPGVAPALAPKLSWNAASQRRLYESFVWDRVPNTTQVLLAQEELWVYGLFCRILGGFVKDATGFHDSPLTSVEELAVGFPATVDSSSDREVSRIIVPKASAEAPPDGMRMMDAPPGVEAPAQAPWHPRFSEGGGARGAGPGGPGGPGGDQPAGPSDDDYRGWIYVDLEGKPLSVADLAAKSDMQMVHLMPFVLRLRIDQRELDRLLLSLAASPVPIDVRQVRVNPGTVADASADPSLLRGGPVAAPSNAAGAVGRPHDLLVELRGSVALATNPAAAPPPQPPGPVP